ncbi:hypothetical protein MHUMG1_01733 [Metarhizium humberi]|uniref:Uncharacterized protein n=1 Tax=Metarhizium humberi TaxID=2596975 RepID=A0A9P8SAF6_9HYPO|nr:hypothetical protein MHUMG1_01733 [Metarhizium humberi]
MFLVNTCLKGTGPNFGQSAPRYFLCYGVVLGRQVTCPWPQLDRFSARQLTTAEHHPPTPNTPNPADTHAQAPSTASSPLCMARLVACGQSGMLVHILPETDATDVTAVSRQLESPSPPRAHLGPSELLGPGANEGLCKTFPSPSSAEATKAIPDQR